MSISVNTKLGSERIVIDGEKFKSRAIVAISRAHQEWFPHLRGRIGLLIARHFSGMIAMDLTAGRLDTEKN